MKKQGGNQRKVNFKRRPLPMATKKIDDAQNKRIVNIEKKLKGIKNEIELKHNDYKFDIVDFTNNNSVSIVPLNLLAQGTTDITRIGDIIHMTSVHIRGVIRRDPVELSGQTVRMVLLYDRGTQGALPQYNQVFDGTTVTGNDYIVHRPYNMDYFPDRFKILYDKSYVLNPSVPDGWVDASGTITVSGYGPVEKIINKKIRVNKKTTYGLGTTAAITSIASGSLILLLVGSEADNGAPASFIGSSRVYFRDA